MGCVTSSPSVVFVVTQDATTSVPLDGHDFDLVASGAHIFVARDRETGAVWQLGDGIGQLMQWKVIADNCADLRALSVHSATVIGIARDGTCRIILSDGDDGDIDWSTLDPLLNRGGVPPLVEVVGHSPEKWLLGRTDGGEKRG